MVLIISDFNALDTLETVVSTCFFHKSWLSVIMPRVFEYLTRLILLSPNSIFGSVSIFANLCREPIILYFIFSLFKVSLFANNH